MATPAERFRERYRNDPEFRAREIARQAEVKRKRMLARFGGDARAMAEYLAKRGNRYTRPMTQDERRESQRTKERARDRHVRHATPPWADRAAIRAVYREARKLRSLGYDVHVDHVVPLRGALVSGLHVASNLRIIHAHANLAKGNSVPKGLLQPCNGVA